MANLENMVKYQKGGHGVAAGLSAAGGYVIAGPVGGLIGAIVGPLIYDGVAGEAEKH